MPAGSSSDGDRRSRACARGRGRPSPVRPSEMRAGPGAHADAAPGAGAGAGAGEERDGRMMGESGEEKGLHPLRHWYESEIAAGRLETDPLQARVVAALAELAIRLESPPEGRLCTRARRRRAGRRGGGVLARLAVHVPRLFPPRAGSESVSEPGTGLYVWGGVGRGKTLLVDAFFSRVRVSRKQRIHFHRFMQAVHGALRERRDEADPLDRVACDWAGRLRLLVLDELHVSDITDAMILGRLFECLLERGVSLVTTSNLAPDELYRDGLQRARFLPAIELLKARLRVMELEGGVDYRLRALEAGDLYFSPLGDEAERALRERFRALAQGRAARPDCVVIQGRRVPVRGRSDGVVWFDFETLCAGPRSPADYIEIARCHHTVLLSGIPVFGSGELDRVTRFIALLDELYDRGVNLVVSAAAEPEALYPGGRKRFEFERAASRLRGMGSREYLARPHRPD